MQMISGQRGNILQKSELTQRKMITVIHQVIWPVQLQLDRKGVESESDVQDEPGKRRFRGLTFVKPLQPACHASPGPLSSACFSAACRFW